MKKVLLSFAILMAVGTSVSAVTISTNTLDVVSGESTSKPSTINDGPRGGGKQPKPRSTWGSN